VFEVFYGGARGGGKTDGMLGEWLAHAGRHGKHAIGLMVRRRRTELVETIERSKALYAPLGATWHEQDKMWRMPNGARLRFAYLENDADADNYMGHNYTRVYIEEIGNFPSPKPVMKLMATLRSGAGVPVGFRATGNPGGPGHQWVKARYIDPVPGGWKIIKDSFKNPFTGEKAERERVYIPSRLTDNAYLNGPEYVATLQMSGSDTLVRAWLEGDWDIVDGAYFDCWSAERHVVRPFTPPEHWTRFRSFDWGSARPFSVGWWAVATEAFEAEGKLIPAGALVRYREWYGAAEPNVGLKLTAEQVAEGIAQRDGGDAISYSVADPAIFSQDGGPSIAERMWVAGKILFRKADNRRVAAHGAMGGWDQMRARMIGEDGRPMIYCFSTCTDSIRTIPALQHDDSRPEDVDTDGEDHCFTSDTLVRTYEGVYSFAELMGKEGLVRSHDGAWHSFRSVRLVKRDQPIVRLAFSDGTTIRCTPDHRFLTKNGWMDAKDLAGMKALSLSHAPFKSFAGSGITSVVGDTLDARVNSFIAKCGRRTGVLYRRAGTYITRIATDAITLFQIWIAFLLSPTSLANMVLNTVSAGSSTLRKHVLRPASGTAARTARSGIDSITSNTARLRSSLSGGLPVANAGSLLQSGLAAGCFAPTSVSRHTDAFPDLMMIRASARSVAPSSKSTDTARSRHAREPVGPFPALAVGPACLSVSDAGRSDVYCFTVPDTGNFELANGVIAAQCADEWRYACMSRPYTRPKPQPPKPLVERRNTEHRI